MPEYKQFLTLSMQHPLIHTSQWILLPSSHTEQYLAQNRLRMAFSQGKLSIFGIIEEEVKPSKKAMLEEMCLYLFCKDIYFQRVSELPLYIPGQEFLFLSFSPKGEGTNTFIDIAPARPWLIGDISAVRKRHIGTPHGIPPCGLLHLPRVTKGASYDLTWDIATQKIYWAYLISPLPSRPDLVSIIGAPESFISRPVENGLLFVSKKPISLSASGYKGMSLMLGEEGMVLMEHLPSPSLSQIKWDNDLNNYQGTVLLDFRRHGVIL